MTNFDKLKQKNIEEMAQFLTQFGIDDGNAPWDLWWATNYCEKCESLYVFAPYLEKDVPVSYCELYNKCKLCPDLKTAPSPRKIVEMWLKLEEN